MTINTSWVLHNYITHYLWDMPMLPDIAMSRCQIGIMDHSQPLVRAPDVVPADAGEHEAAVAPTNGIELDSIRSRH